MKKDVSNGIFLLKQLTKLYGMNNRKQKKRKKRKKLIFLPRRLVRCFRIASCGLTSLGKNERRAVCTPPTGGRPPLSLTVVACRFSQITQGKQTTIPKCERVNLWSLWNIYLCLDCTYLLCHNDKFLKQRRINWMRTLRKCEGDREIRRRFAEILQRICRSFIRASGRNSGKKQGERQERA